MVSADLRRRFRFFLSAGERAASALRLARAERAVFDSDDDLDYLVSSDDSPDLSFMTDDERAQVREVLCIALVRACPDHGFECRHAESLASLCGIIDPDDSYLRVIKAELACEAMAEIVAEV